MRFLVGVLALLMAGSSLALDPETFRLNNGSNLVELCGMPAEDPLYPRAMEFCNGYLAGAYHYYAATQPAQDRFVCAPDPPPRPADVMRTFVVWAKANPRYMSERAVDALFRYLGETYPCKN